MSTVTIVDNGNGTKTIQVRGNLDARFSIDGILATYSSINVHVTKTSIPRAHVGISEISFGNMRRFSSDRQQDTTVVTESIDPLGLQSYATRLDTTLNDIRDTDVSSFARVSINVITRNEFGEPATFPLGMFYVTAVDPVGSNVTRISAEDVRAILDKNTVSLTIEVTDSVRDKLADMLDGLNIAYILDMALDVNPSHQLVYTDVSPIKIITDTSSRYGIPISVGQQGEIVLSIKVPGSRNIESSNIMRWPMSESAEVRPNMYVFEDNSNLDLRGDMTVPKVVYSISNQMLTTPQDKQGIVDKIVANHNVNSVTVETTGDPRIEMGDMLAIETRDGSIEVEVMKIENRVGSSYRQRITGLARVVTKGVP